MNCMHTDIDEWLEGTDDCPANTDCEDIGGGLVCSCSQGYIEDIDGNCIGLFVNIVSRYHAQLLSQNHYISSNFLLVNYLSVH